MILKNVKYFFSLLVVLLFFSQNSSGQFYSSGCEPFSVKWEQLNTDNFQVIFPKGFYIEANKLLNYFENSRPQVNKSLGANAKKISIVLHNQSVISNGFVTMAPRRMEIVTTPPSNLEAMDWYQTIALHEYRHVAQIDRMNLGFTKALSYLIGQTSFGLPAIELPLWIIEGDAVATETALSSSGRGRTAEFELQLKAIITDSSKNFSYDKSYLGSYKDNIPDRYELGWQLIKYSRERYGAAIWKNAIENTSRHSIIPFYLNNKLKKSYGTNLDQIYKNTFDTLKLLWSNQINTVILSDYSIVPIQKSQIYTNYRFPMVNSESSMFLVKSGLNDIEQIIEVDKNGKEKKEFFTGKLLNPSFSIGNDVIAWAEIIPDIRWDQRDYSIIKTFNTISEKENTISHKSRYFFPDVSSDDTKIVCIENDLNNNCFLIILDCLTGKLLFKSEIINNEFLQYPKWFNDSTIAVTGTSNKGKSIYLFDIKSKTWKMLYGPCYYNICQLEVWNNLILFKADFSEADNIYAINSMTEKIYKVTSVKLGVTDPMVNKSGELFYSDYSESGFFPVKILLNPKQWNEPEIYDKTEKIKELVAQENNNIQTTDFKELSFVAKPYHKIDHLFKIHSWLPFYINPTFENISDNEVKPGILILSQNILNTSISSIGLSFNENNVYLHPTFSFKGFYPVFDLSSKIGGYAKYYRFPEGIHPKDSVKTKYTITLKTYIPFNFSSDKYYRLFQPEIKTEYDNALYYKSGAKSGIISLQYKLSFYRYLRSSIRDLHPDWAQTINLSYTHTIKGSHLFGDLLYTSVSLYFPGLFKNHSIKNSFYLQLEQVFNHSLYFYPYNYLSLSRGFLSNINSFKAKKIYKYSFDYAFPLFYPDFSWRPIIYVKRIHLNIFSDVTYGKHVIEFNEISKRLNSVYYSSIGFDLLADFHLFRFLFPVTFGPKVVYLFNNQHYIGINFYLNTSIF